MALALVTNDDGVDSVGIGVLARGALAAGFDVLVAAPSWNSSGVSAALTAVEKDGKVVLCERSIDGVPEGRVFGVEAAPAFIVRAAASGAFGDRPDVVLSGVNHGENLGHVILHSGTVGAVLTGSTYGLPGMAISLADGSTRTGMRAVNGTRWRWDTAEVVVAEVLPRLHDTDRDHPPVLNVNVPAVAPEEWRGVADARLARFGAVQANVTESGAGWVKLDFGAAERDHEPGTDAALLSEGYATITHLVAVCEASPAG